MEIIKEFEKNQTRPLIPINESLQTESIKKSKAADYFDYIYNYPPNIKLRWSKLDDFNTDLFLRRNYGVFQHSIPLFDFFEERFFKSLPMEAISEPYSTSQHLDAFLDKINTSNFFIKKTKEIQNSLANVPVFVILNGNREIILNKPSNTLGAKTFTNYINEKLYDSCGAFDPRVEKRLELGLFFLNHLDAEVFLKEVARSDFEGTKTLGLSVHCISLDSAYKITREHHPGIDFRFVPNFNEVKELLNYKNVGSSNLIIEREQQQLRFRPRTNNLFPYLNKLGALMSPSYSFLQYNEYFKGIPIYIVQVKDTPRSFGVEQYFKVAGLFDHISSGWVQYIDNAIGFGHQWIIQGSIKHAAKSEKVENYIFFEKEQAIKFVNKAGRKIARYTGARTTNKLNIESLVRKPKILVYNLEDFLEDWEDQILKKSSDANSVIETIFNSGKNYFVPPLSISDEVSNFSQKSQFSTVQKFGQALNVKFRVLQSTLGVFFSI